MVGEAAEFTIPEEMKKWIGREMQLGTAAVEAGAITKFADAIKDPNPLYRDVEYAKATPYGGVVAPPTFIHVFRSIGYARFQVEPMPWKNTTRLNGGNELEFYVPLRPGDVITGRAKLTDIYGRHSRSVGPMIVTVVEMTYTNQAGDVVGKQLSTTLICEAKD
jgi:acyl dehydratase